MFVFWNLFFGKLFFKLSCVCLPLEKLINEKFGLVSKKLFSWKIWKRKHFPEVVKNLEISYYLLIISNLILKFLIAIYILFWIFIFQFHLLKFNFYINFGPHFYNCYLLFPYHFFIESFMYQIWFSFFWLLLILFEIIYKMLIIIILISSSFIFFIFRFDLYYFDYYLFYLR